MIRMNELPQAVPDDRIVGAAAAAAAALVGPDDGVDGGSLSEYSRPEKNDRAESLDELRGLLEDDYRVSLHRTVLDRIELFGDGSIEFDGIRVPCTQGFMEGLAGRIGMPLPYAYAVDFDLFKINVKRRQEACATALTVCCSRGMAVSIAGEGYQPARNADVLATLPLTGAWEFRAAQLSDRGIEVDLVVPGRVARVAPGDEIELGIRLTNSETGHGGLKASLYSLRLACTNGAVMRDALGTARWNYDRRVRYDTSIAKFWKDVVGVRGQGDRHAELYGDGVHRPLRDVEVGNLWRRLRSLVPASRVDGVMGVSAADRLAIQQAIRHRDPTERPLDTGYALWDVHNAITAAARAFDFRRRSHLERIGGSMLAHASPN